MLEFQAWAVTSSSARLAVPFVPCQVRVGIRVWVMVGVRIGILVRVGVRGGVRVNVWICSLELGYLGLEWGFGFGLRAWVMGVMVGVRVGVRGRLGNNEDLGYRHG